MKLLYLCLFVLPLAGQTSEQAPAAPNPSVLEVKPGEKAIKNKDLWDQTGVFHPFGRMPRYVLNDQKHVWTAPFHTSKSDAKWWGIFGGATAALIASDQYTMKSLPNTADQRRLGTWASHIGAAYTLVPLSAAFYFVGTAAKTQHFRETGLIAFETLINTTIVVTSLKAVTRRARPLQSDGKGHFWDSEGIALNASFPSGHAANTFALASVFAHQYRSHIAVPIVAYSLAGLVVGARIAAQKHFAGDVLAGGALGWFIGDYIFAKRHNPEIDHKAVSRRVLDHLRWGPAYPVSPASIVSIPDGAVTLRPPNAAIRRRTTLGE